MLAHVHLLALERSARFELHEVALELLTNGLHGAVLLLNRLQRVEIKIMINSGTLC